MTRQKKVLLFSSPLLFAGYAAAQFGLPSVVIDPTAIAKITTEIGEVIRVATAAESSYTQLQMDARFVTNKSQWRGAFVRAANSYFTSSPITDPWAKTALSGLGAANSYGTASVSLANNPTMVVFGSPFSPHYATAQIGTASGMYGLQALGNANTFAAQMAQPIANCESSALTTDPTNNTTPSLMGVQAGCTALMLQQNQAALQVSTARLQLELLQGKAMTDNFSEYANMTTGFDTTLSSTPMIPGNQAQSITSAVDR